MITIIVVISPEETLFNISEAILGLTLAAIGTSLPELAVTFASVKNKAEKVLLGNIIGSNIINILGALGISSLIGTLIVPEDFSGISFYYLLNKRYFSSDVPNM